MLDKPGHRSKASLSTELLDGKSRPKLAHRPRLEPADARRSPRSLPPERECDRDWQVRPVAPARLPDRRAIRPADRRAVRLTLAPALWGDLIEKPRRRTRRGGALPGRVSARGGGISWSSLS